MVSLSLHGIYKSFAGRPPAQALAGADLTVPSGAITAVLGPSGCGKTTLLRLIVGFERPDAGEIRLDGQLIAGSGVFVPPEERDFGIVPQEGALFPHLTVEQNVAFGLRKGWSVASRGSRQARRERVRALLDLVGMPDLGRRRPSELSGGQQQRVALARALAPEPKVVLLDEPFSSIDTALRLELREEVCDLLRRIGTTAILVTHDQGEALSLASHVAVMRAGRVIQSGPPDEIYATPIDPDTATFLGEAVLLPGTLDGEPGSDPLYAACALGRVPVRVTNPGVATRACTVMIRPEQIQIGETGTVARIVRVSFFGHDTVVHVRLGAGGDGPVLRARVFGSPPAVGDVVHVHVDGDVTAYLLSVAASDERDPALQAPFA